MSPGIGVGVGLPFVHLQRRSSSVLDQLFGGGQGMYAVAGLREGSGAWTDQTGGGRHVTLPGSTNNPIRLDHSSVDYFYWPSGNFMIVLGLSPSTDYDITVTYLDDSTGVGGLTSNGSGSLVLIGAPFNDRSVKEVSVEPDGGGTPVAGFTATFVTENATGFTEPVGSHSVTINRSSSGYKLAVVKRAKDLTATDDYGTTATDDLFSVAADESATLFWGGVVHGTNASSVLASVGGGLYIQNTTSPEYAGVANDGSDTATDSSSGAARSQRVILAARLDRSTNEIELFVNGTPTGSPADASAVGALVGDTLQFGRIGAAGSYADAEHEILAFHLSAMSDEDIATACTELQALNS